MFFQVFLHSPYLICSSQLGGFGHLICSCAPNGPPSLVVSSFCQDLGPSYLYLFFPLFWVLCFIDDWQAFIIRGSSRAPQPVQFSRVTEVFRWIHWTWLLYLIQNDRQWGCSSACEVLWDFMVNGLSSRTPATDRLLDMAWTHSKEWAWK